MTSSDVLPARAVAPARFLSCRCRPARCALRRPGSRVAGPASPFARPSDGLRNDPAPLVRPTTASLLRARLREQEQ